MSNFKDQEWLVEVSKGNVPGHSLVHKFGKNPDIDTGSTPEGVWAYGGQFDWSTTSETLYVVSSSTDDDVAGTGMRKLTIEGLDSSLDELVEEVDMDGQTEVETSGSFFRVNRAYSTEEGVYHSANVGDVTITQSTSGDVMGYVAAGFGQTQVAKYTVPNGKTAYILDASVAVERSGTGRVVQAALMQYRNADDVSSPFGGAARLVADLSVVSSTVLVPFPGGIQIPAKTDLWIEVESVSANNTAVVGRFTLLLVDN